MIEALLGAAAGVLTIFVARAIRGQHWLYSVGLLVLPGLYALFALSAGEPAVGVREVLYGIPFIVAGLLFAFVSARHSAVVVGAFWMLHGLYDLTHGRLLANPGVPPWYPIWCCSVDVVVGAYLLWLSRRVPDADSAAPRSRSVRLARRFAAPTCASRSTLRRRSSTRPCPRFR